jgi:hypothetical protein
VQENKPNIYIIIVTLSKGIEEVAFYDALAANDTAGQVMGMCFKQIARELTYSIKNNMNID